MNVKINPGTIRCKFCNRIKSNAISDCLCSGTNTWPNPNATRRTIKEAQLKKDGQIITPFSKQFLKAMRDKKKSNLSRNTPNSITTGATPQDNIKPTKIPFKSKRDLCPSCRKNQKLVVSNRCNECYHSNKHGQIARIKSLKEKKK